MLGRQFHETEIKAEERLVNIGLLLTAVKVLKASNHLLFLHTLKKRDIAKSVS